MCMSVPTRCVFRYLCNNKIIFGFTWVCSMYVVCCCPDIDSHQPSETNENKKDEMIWMPKWHTELHSLCVMRCRLSDGNLTVWISTFPFLILLLLLALFLLFAIFKLFSFSAPIWSVFLMILWNFNWVELPVVASCSHFKWKSIHNA